MKNALKIYKRDIRNIVTNRIALVIIIGLMILPSLYAWFNIKSSWDPYSNTNGISVAVVNKDKGVFFKEHNVNVGEQLVEQLKHNDKIGWKFTTEEDAKKGVDNGSYYASIVVPENFSKKITSILGKNPEKPSLIYSVNEKRNAIAPKITDKGASTVQAEISKTFIKTINGVIFDVFNQLGLELEKGKPKFKNLGEMIIYINDKIPDINKAVDQLETGVITTKELTKKVQDEIPQIQETIDKAMDIADKGTIFLDETRNSINNLGPYIKEDLIIIRDILDTSQVLTRDSIGFISSNTPKAKILLSTSKDKLLNVNSKIDSVINLLNALNKGNGNISSFVTSLQNVKSDLNQKIYTINEVLGTINKGQRPATSTLMKLNNMSSLASNTIGTLVYNFDIKIMPSINNLLSDLNKVVNNSVTILSDAKRELPKLRIALNTAYNATNKGTEGIKIIKQKLPDMEKSVQKIATKVKKLENEDKLNDVIDLLRNDSNKESDFIASPVELKQNRIYPIPNYGSGMSPFFTTLALWVGCLILVSILTVHVKEFDGEEKLKTHEIYFGRYLTFMTIGLFQALIVTLGDIFLLKTYVVNKVSFVLLAMFISAIFCIIIYSLVSVFGNVGKALGIIMLVLQISASGGTFPIEVTPKFFQNLNPFLPFTYAIAGMRETVGGIIPELLMKDIGILLIYVVVSICISLLLKEKLGERNKMFVEKFKETGLSGE